jgi:hypothetical protein
MGSSQLFEDFAPRLTHPMRLSRWPARFPEAARLLSVITDAVPLIGRNLEKFKEQERKVPD